MFKVYCDGFLLYDDKIDNLKIYEPKIELELNKTGSFTFEIHPGHPYFEMVKKLKSIITVFQDDFLLFRGRVLNDELGFHNEKYVECEGEMAFLLDSIIRPYNYTGSISGFLQMLISAHNSQVDASHQFTLGNVTVTDSNNYIARSSVDYKNTLDVINESLINTLGGYVQGKSKLNVSVAASGAYNSTISSYKVVVDGATFYGSSITSGILTASGSKTVSVTVTDSRGRTATTTRTITVIAYTTPTITSFSCIRCNADGSENAEGTYLKATINFSISSVNSKNTKSWSLQYKRKSATTWTTATSGSVYTYNGSYVSTTGILSADYAFDIKLVISDFFSTAEKTLEIGTAFTLMDFNASGKGMAFGKVSEKADAIEFNLPVQFLQSGKLLWSGALYMSSGQKANLTEKISDQMNGIVLVFSSYQNGAATNYWFHSFFVHKRVCNQGWGHMFNMATEAFGVVANKCIYIGDQDLSGHAKNTQAGTSNGITYNNGFYVLRYVIGV